MALHDDLRDVFVEVIDEYLDVEEFCITKRRPAGGYAATLLLFCTVDAMGENLVRKEKWKLRHRDIGFWILSHQSFGLNLEREQIEKLGEWYRHKLAHLGLVPRGVLSHRREP